jgi:hypothetical protein
VLAVRHFYLCCYNCLNDPISKISLIFLHNLVCPLVWRIPDNLSMEMACRCLFYNYFPKQTIDIGKEHGRRGASSYALLSSDFVLRGSVEPLLSRNNSSSKCCLVVHGETLRSRRVSQYPRRVGDDDVDD